MTTWLEQISHYQCDELFVGSGIDGDEHPFARKTWNPGKKDNKAAWTLFTQMRTRITTQPLAYRHGDEETALESVHKIFEMTRSAIADNEGCVHFATLAVYVLNVHIRPFTAYWHKAQVAGDFSRSDMRYRFRRELIGVQKKLRLFMNLLGYLAEGDDFVPILASGIETDLPYVKYDLGKPIAFGVTGSLVPVNLDEEIDKAEKDEVAARRKHYGLPDDDQDAVGLALSGGGIRSATFSLGVTQFLARKGILKQVDFLSTVSGGGYLGSFMSSYLNSPLDPEVGLDPENHTHPFGKQGDVESKAVRYLRNHSKYLTEGGFLNIATAVGQMAYGILINLFMLLPIVLGAVFLASFSLDEAFRSAVSKKPDGLPDTLEPYLLAVAIFLIVLAIFLPIVQNHARNNPSFRPLRKWYQLACIAVFAVLVAMFLWGLLPYGYHYYHELIHGASGGVGSESHDIFNQGMLTFLAAAFPILIGVLQFLAGHRRTVRKLVGFLLLLSGPIFFLVAFYFLSDIFIVRHDATVMLGLIFVFIVAYAGLFLNINFSSLHRFYRNRLSRTYLRRPKSNKEKSEDVDCQKLSAMLAPSHSGETKAPYHLINCALNIPGSDAPSLRGREADLFLFSKHYCGSPLADYAPTKQWEQLDGDLDLGTAMAISAAAAAPRMGANTNRKFSFLLAILNIRLNYWLPSPNSWYHTGKFEKINQTKRWTAPGFWYFFKEVTGLFMSEKDHYLNLSDGGHIENLAIYELLRRRCKFIIAIDGEADPDRTFHGLLTLVRLASIDLGATILPRLDELRMDEEGNSHSHFLLCPIDYVTGEKGFLLYIKSSMTGNESEFLHNWRRLHPSFPHETTADQLYNESQFEAYRALGEHVAEELFRPEVVNPIDPNQPGLGAAPTVREWFQGLANNLLEPEHIKDSNESTP